MATDRSTLDHTSRTRTQSEPPGRAANAVSRPFLPRPPQAPWIGPINEPTPSTLHIIHAAPPRLLLPEGTPLHRRGNRLAAQVQQSGRDVEEPHPLDFTLAGQARRRQHEHAELGVVAAVGP